MNKHIISALQEAALEQAALIPKEDPTSLAEDKDALKLYNTRVSYAHDCLDLATKIAKIETKDEESHPATNALLEARKRLAERPVLKSVA